MNWYFELKKKWLSDAVATTIVWLEFSFTLNTNYLFDANLEFDLGNVVSFEGDISIPYDIDPDINVETTYLNPTSIELEVDDGIEVKPYPILVDALNVSPLLLVDDNIEIYLNSYVISLLPYSLTLVVDDYIDFYFRPVVVNTAPLTIVIEVPPYIEALVNIVALQTYPTSLELELGGIDVEVTPSSSEAKTTKLDVIVDDVLDFYIDPHLSNMLPYNLKVIIDDYLNIYPDVEVANVYSFSLNTEIYLPIDSNVSLSSDTAYPFALTLSYKALPTIEITFGEPDFDEMNIILDYYYNLGINIGELSVLYSVSTGILVSSFYTIDVGSGLELDLDSTSDLSLSDICLTNQYLIDIYAELDQVAYPQLYVEIGGISLSDITLDQATTKPFSAKFPVIILPIDVMDASIDISNLSEVSGFTLPIPYSIGTYLSGIDSSNLLNFTTNELTYKYSLDIDLTAVLGSLLIFSDLDGWIVTDLTGLEFKDLYYKI